MPWRAKVQTEVNEKNSIKNNAVLMQGEFGKKSKSQMGFELTTQGPRRGRAWGGGTLAAPPPTFLQE